MTKADRAWCREALARKAIAKGHTMFLVVATDAGRFWLFEYVDASKQ